VPRGKVVLLLGAEFRHASRFGRVPTLAIVDPPRMDHDDGGLGRLQVIGKLDDAAGVVGKSPCPHAQIGSFVNDQRRRLEVSRLHDRLKELRMICQQRFWIFDSHEPIVVQTRRRRRFGGRRNGDRQQGDRTEGNDDGHTTHWCLLKNGSRTA
jgi:hypothetical protein